MRHFICALGLVFNNAPQCSAMLNRIVEICKSMIVKDSFAAGAKINEFVQGFIDGKLEQKLRSEETPEAQVCVAVAATSMLIPCSYCVTSPRPYCVTSARPAP